MSFSFNRYLPGILIALILITAAASSGSFAGKQKEAALKTDIISATVYKNQAQVTRSGKLSLKAGQVRIVCDDLPHSFNTSSLQVEGHGSAAVSIIGTDVIRVQDDPAENPRYTELFEKLETLAIRRDSIDIEINALQIRLQFVEQLGKLPMQQKPSEEFPAEIFQVEGWKALMDFLQNERTGSDAKIYSLNLKKQDISKDIAWIRQELDLVKRGTRTGYRVAIDCAVESAGELTLELKYIVPGTAWVPEYRISFDPGSKGVALVYNSRIKQSTGEDWNGVDITLSTAMPHAGAAPPELQPHYLSRIMPRAKKAQMMEMESHDMVEPVADRGGIVKTGDEDHVRGGRADHFEAEIFSSEFAASFRVPAMVDLVSGADSKRIRITEGTMPAELSLYTAPRLRR